MFKQLLTFCGAILFFITSCASPANDSDKKKIVCTIPQIGDLVQAIGGDRMECHILVRGELNPHSYELVKGDGDRIASADLVFYNGLGLEHGASVSSMIQSHPHAVALGDAIRQQHPDRVLTRGDTLDPHIWMDLSLWKEGIPTIVEALSSIDPEGAADFQKRAHELNKKIEEADQKIWTLLHQVPESQRYLVTSHDAFQYFTRRYLAEEGEADWSKRFAAPEGLAPDGQLSIADLRAIVEHLEEHQISVIFPESNVSRDSIRKIADVSRVRICKEALFGDSIRGSYIDSMLKNGEILAKELGE